MARSKRVSLAAFALACLIVSSIPALNGQEQKPPVAAQENAKPVTLEPGAKSLERNMKGGETHSFLIHSDAGLFLHAVVEQLGIDVSLMLYDPGGKKIAAMDSPNGTTGLEQISTIAEASGDYRLDVSSEDKTAKAAHYSIRIAPLRLPRDEDKARIAAERAFSDATQLSGSTAADSLRAAIKKYSASVLLWQTAKDSYEETLTLLTIGAAYSSLGEKQKALDSFNQALPLEQAAGDRKQEGATLGQIGETYIHLGEKQKALDSFNMSMPLSRETGDLRVVAIDLEDMADVHFDLGQKQKAADDLRQALQIERELGDRPLLAGTLGSLGFTLKDLGRTQEALDALQEAATISRELGDRPNEAMHLGDIGFTYFESGEKNNAVEFDEQALAVYKEIGSLVGQARMLNNLGGIYGSIGQQEKALDFYLKALPLRRQTGNRTGEASTLSNIGSVYKRLGQKQAALDYFNQALSIEREIGDSGAAITLGQIGDVYSGLDQPEKALENFTQALSMERAVGDRRNEASTLNMIGVVYYRQGQKQVALNYFNQALPIRRAVRDPSGEATTLNNIGEVYFALQDKPKALENYSQSLALSQPVGDRSQEATTLRNMESLAYTSSPDLAIIFGKQAVNVLQGIRRDNKGLQDSLRASYEKSIESYYRSLANLLVERERFGEAEEVLDLLKDKEASDFIRRDSVSDELHLATLLEPEKKALERYDQIVDQVGDLGQKKAALLAKRDKGQLTTAELAEVTQLDKDLAAANTVLLKFLEEEEKALAPASAQAKEVGELKDAAGLQGKLAKLGPDVVAIYTLVTPDKYVALLVTAGARKAYTSPIKEADLNKKIFEFRQQLQNPNSDPRPLAQELYGIVFPEGLRHDLDAMHAKTIMWSIDSTLRYIPFAALYDGHEYLVESFRQSLITPASLGNLIDDPLPQWTGIGFGVSDGTGGASPLPSVPGELHGIFRETADGKSPIPGVVLLNEAFTHQSFEDSLRRKRNPVVHIATHFDSRPGVEADSSLLLGDGALSLAEIDAQPNLFDGVDLLTLSACNTAFTNKSEDGREVDSFGTIAQRLGAKGVIASLWSVDDDSTANLMQTMYRLRQQSGMTKDEALRQAQLALADGELKPHLAKDAADRGGLPNRPKPAAGAATGWSHPYYWAPFILIGNWK